jgi:hypothetical protein
MQAALLTGAGELYMYIYNAYAQNRSLQVCCAEIAKALALYNVSWSLKVLFG